MDRKPDMTGGAMARRNELLVRVRQPLDMALQVLAAVAVAFLLDDYLSLPLRIGYLAATVAVTGLQFLTHRVFMADRARRAQAQTWRWRLIGVYSLNGALFGAAAVVTVRLPYESAPLLALPDGGRINLTLRRAR